jgi:hypothetical protein
MRNSVNQLPYYHPKQKFFRDSEATQILLGGDTRGGKTAGFKIWIIEMCATIPGLQCDIFRLHEDDVIAGYMTGDFSLLTLTAQWIKDGLVKYNQTELRFWNGSQINLEHCSTDNAMSKHQGIPKHIRAFDEAGQIPERRMKWLTGWMILNEEMKAKLPPEYREYFPKVVFLSNPLGPSKPYLRKRFVKARPKFEIEKVGAWKLQYIPFRVEDNTSEDAETTRLRVAEIADEATAKALLNEDWDAQIGNFFHMWDEDRHTIKDFIIPDFWLRFRTYDYGSYEPWACLWWAVSPGAEVDGRYIPRGCLVCYREWYGCKAEHPVLEADKNVTNLAPKGWSHKDMANGIIDRTEERFDQQPTFTDKFPFIKLGGRSIAHDFQEQGLTLTLGELDRKNRAAMTISKLNGEKLLADSEEKWPMMLFFQSCKYCRDYIPMVERHENEGKQWDYAESGEATHIVDCVTLAAVAHKIIHDAPVTDKTRMDNSVNHPKNTKKSIKDIIPELTF